MTSRAEDLEQRLAALRERLDAACTAAGRDPGAVALTVITKFFPAADVRLLADLGVREVGENRHQEGEQKAGELADLGLRWHFVGGLQSNKAGAVAGWADVVASVDRRKLVSPLDRGAGAAGREVDVLVQVSLDEDAGASSRRAGAAPAEVVGLADAVAEAAHLRLCGLMAVAPREGDPAEAFARLADLHATLLDAHPGATELSAGMSGDLEQAVSAGATRVRIGSAILGTRPGNA